jgi:hypothetical protein
MANNRMVIVCKKCNKARYLAKWYPSTGWYAAGEPEPDPRYAVEYIKLLDTFLGKHDHSTDSHRSEESFEIRYESSGEKWEYDEDSKQK